MSTTAMTMTTTTGVRSLRDTVPIAQLHDIMVMLGYDVRVPATQELARAAAVRYAHHEINRLATVTRPQRDDVNRAFAALDHAHPDLARCVAVELSRVLECLSGHEPDYWDDIAFAGMWDYLTSEWFLSPDDADYAVAWLVCLDRRGREAMLLGPGATIPDPTTKDAQLLLALTTPAVHDRPARDTWHDQYVACRRCWPT